MSGLNYLVGVKFTSSGNLMGSMTKLLAGFGALVAAQGLFNSTWARLSAAGIGVFAELTHAASEYQNTLIGLQNSMVGLVAAHKAMGIAMTAGAWSSAFSPQQIAQSERLIAQWAAGFPTQNAAAYTAREAQLKTWLQYVYQVPKGQVVGYEAQMMRAANTYVRLTTGLHGAATITPTMNLMSEMLRHGHAAKNFREYLNFVTEALSGRQAGIIRQYLNTNQIMGLGALVGQVKGAGPGLMSIITTLAGKMPGESVAALLMAGMGAKPSNIKSILGHYRFAPMTLPGFEANPLGTIKSFFDAYLGPHATWVQATRKLGAFGPNALALWELVHAYSPAEMKRYEVLRSTHQMNVTAWSSVSRQWERITNSFSRMFQILGVNSGAVTVLTELANGFSYLANTLNSHPDLASILGKGLLGVSGVATGVGFVAATKGLLRLLGLFGEGSAALVSIGTIASVGEALAVLFGIFEVEQHRVWIIKNVGSALERFFSIFEKGHVPPIPSYHSPYPKVAHPYAPVTIPHGHLKAPTHIPGWNGIHVPVVGPQSKVEIHGGIHIHAERRDDAESLTDKMRHALANLTEGDGIYISKALIGPTYG